MSTIRQDPFVRAAQVVGDFANPFYAEERQRDVWNGAQAFGLQLAVWVMLSAGAISVWWVGAAVVPYVLTALGLLGLVCVLTLAYAQRLGVDVASPQRLLRLRLVPFGVIVVVLAGGLVRSAIRLRRFRRRSGGWRSRRRPDRRAELPPTAGRPFVSLGQTVG